MAETNKKDKPQNATLIGYGYYVFNRRPHHDKDNDKKLYKLDLVLTEKDGTPITQRSRKTGQEVNMIERAKELGLLLKDPYGVVDGTHVRIKREQKTKEDGSVTPAPETKNTKGEDFTQIIGNGSKVQVEFAAIPIRKGKYQGKNNTAYLNKIVVIDLVPYISDNDEFDFSSSNEEEESTPTTKKKKMVELEDVVEEQEEMEEGEFVEVDD